MKNIRSFLAIMMEETALDWLPIVFLRHPLPIKPVLSEEEQKNKKQEIHTRISHQSYEELQIIHDAAERLLEDQEKHRLNTESKSVYLLGFTTLASTFILSFAQFLFQATFVLSRWWFVALYGSIAFSLIMVVYLAREVVKTDTFLKPPEYTILRYSKLRPQDTYETIVVEYFVTYEYNERVINKKGTYLSGAQDWFRNTIVLLGVLMLLLTVNLALSSAENQSQQAENPIYVLVVTPTLFTTPSSVPPLIPSVQPSTSPSMSIPTITSTQTLTLTTSPTLTRTP